LSQTTSLPVIVPEDPDLCVVRGALEASNRQGEQAAIA